jgi:hypothetical protein
MRSNLSCNLALPGNRHHLRVVQRILPHLLAKLQVAASPAIIDKCAAYVCVGMWVMLDIVPNHAGYFAPETIHEMTFTKPEYYHSCSRECLSSSNCCAQRSSSCKQ